jgi:hypothetical protein
MDGECWPVKRLFSKGNVNKRKGKVPTGADSMAEWVVEERKNKVN